MYYRSHWSFYNSLISNNTFFLGNTFFIRIFEPVPWICHGHPVTPLPYTIPNAFANSPMLNGITYSTNKPCFLCHPSRLSLPYSSWTLFFPSGHWAHAGFDPSMIHTISSGTGNSVSIAEANGWISSGQWWSQTHSMVLQFEQKFRSEEQTFSSGVPRSLMPEYFLVMTLVNVDGNIIYVSQCMKWRFSADPVSQSRSEWIWMGRTWSDLCPSWYSGYRRCRLGSLPRGIRLLCGRCCKRIAGRELVFETVE